MPSPPAVEASPSVEASPASRGSGARRAWTATLLTCLALIAVWLAVPRPVQLGTVVPAGAAMAAFIVLGLAAASRFGRGAPLLERRLRGEGSLASDSKLLAVSALAGALLGGLLLAVMVGLLAPLEPRIGARLAARAGSPAWLPWCLAFESSVLEEILFRLFLLSGVAWLLHRLLKESGSEPSRAVVRVSVTLSALAFALAHLPGWAAALAVSPLLIASFLLLNGGAGLLLGRIYWRFGIEAAIACHFAADLVIQGLGPGLFAHHAG